MLGSVASSREFNTPLILWVCAAVCAHFMLGEGGDVIATFHDDGVAIANLGARVRAHIMDREQTFEVSSLEAEQDKVEVDPDKAKVEAPKPPPLPSAAPPKPEPKKAEPPKPEPKKPTPEPKKAVAVVKPKEPEPPKAVEPPPQVDHRIAVRQHVKPNQEDNPNARFLGDDANKTDKESVATNTSHDQDDPNPQPNGSHTGVAGLVGDSDRTKIADSDSHPGEKNRGPGERGTEFEVQHDPMPTRPQGATAVPGQAGLAASGGDGRPAGAPTEVEPGTAGPVSPGSAVVIDANGNWTFNPVQAGTGAAAGAAGAGKAAGSEVASTEWLGLGGKAGKGRVNLNLNDSTLVASVGQDQLTKEREADGERRRSEHRGSFQASNFDRWRSAIENYVSSVKPGNQTSLNTARSPFATYLNGMHNRIHPIFAESFLLSLDGLGKDNPMNDPKIYTRLEIIVTRQGRIVKMGVVKTSGITAFDVAALDSVQRASPFGPPPAAIVSPDGRVYLHWEFHREEAIACSTINAAPFMLNVPAAAPAIDPNPGPQVPGPPPSNERGAPPPANINETREGALDVRRAARES
jgi:TonB family protein